MAWAGLLYAGDDAALSHGTALWWDEVLDQAPDRVHLTIPSSRRVVTKKGLRIHRSVVTAESVHPSRTPRRTRIEHSVLGYLDSAGPEPVIDVLTRVVQRRMTTAARLRDALIERGRHPHRSLIVDVLTDVEQGVQSPPSAATSATSSASIACREESATAPRGSARQRGTATSGMPGGPWWSSWTDGRPIRLRAHSGTTGGTTNSPWRATPCSGSAGPMWWADPVTSLRRWPPRCGWGDGPTSPGLATAPTAHTHAAGEAFSRKESAALRSDPAAAVGGESDLPGDAVRRSEVDSGRRRDTLVKTSWGLTTGPS